MSELQQPGDIDDHIAMLVSAVESASHDLAGATAKAAAKEAETLLKAEIDREQTRAYADGREDERDDCDADALRFRWLCEHPDWHFIERLCREFVADSSMEFLTELRRVIDARRSVDLGTFDEHRPANAEITGGR